MSGANHYIRNLDEALIRNPEVSDINSLEELSKKTNIGMEELRPMLSAENDRLYRLPTVKKIKKCVVDQRVFDTITSRPLL